MKFGDRVQETTTTTGTGALTLAGATVGHRVFSEEIGNGNETPYLIEPPVGSSDTWWELSKGTVSADVTLSRTLIKSSTGALIDLPAGSKVVTQVAAAGTLNGKMQVVNHGTDADYARPDVAAVYWTGSVEPANALDGDLWFGG